MKTGVSEFISAIAAMSANASTSACPSHPMTAAGALSVEREWVDALEERDAVALFCVLDPQFADTNWQGALVSRSQVLENLRLRPSSELKLSDLSVSLLGSVAVVRGLNTQSSSNGTASVRFTDVFEYSRGSWHAVAAQETLIVPKANREGQ